MPVQLFRHLKEAIGNLDPEDIRRHTDRPMRLYLYAHREEAFRQMEDFFIPASLSAAKRAELASVISRAPEGFLPAASHDLEIYYEDSPHSVLTPTSQVFAFNAGDPMATIREVLRHRPDLAVPLALHVLPFREEVSKRIVKKVAKENALFALATAIPDIVPLLSLPWAITEFASDTAILTANQIRMAFLLAAANDRDIGYREQKGEIVSLMMGAFGWRAVARELVGKIPMGGGLIPKAAIAYAGTRVVGMSIERYYRIGAQYTRAERHLAYEDAFERGKKLGASLLNGFRNKVPLASIEEPD